MKRIDFDTIDSTNEEAKRRIRGSRVGARDDSTVDSTNEEAKRRIRGSRVGARDDSTVDSTNDEARRMICGSRVGARDDRGGARDDSGGARDDGGYIFDTVITARAQTSGRGRRGRDFFSPDTGDSVYMSFILRPPAQQEALQLLTIAAAVAICRTIKEFGARPSIKWVNDILLDGKKICGILAEGIPYAGSGRPGIAAIILGVGININVPAEDFPPELRETAGSLWLPEGEREGFVQLLCRNVFGQVDPGAVIDAYRHYEETTGREVFVMRQVDPGSAPGMTEAAAGMTVAYAKAIAEDGGLVVVHANGEEETLRSGEVSVLPRGATIIRDTIPLSARL
ncbi:MAG: biotin--[acetyl-CoA-carboxylase] ligase [Clostridiales Family XIII bacterium]|jgi:biotin-[acetyl-CoA-carboxylase] ligase BirA-like protein|nr:biotin--[acetyl-CoA-carboxylase] ligase [Clostridiales Family XIII bacterium]